MSTSRPMERRRSRRPGAICGHGSSAQPVCELGTHEGASGVREADERFDKPTPSETWLGC